MWSRSFTARIFDIRSLDREFGVRVHNLFDTEIAGRFLGLKERGLAALLKSFFEVTADKSFQKADWSQRPLKPDMIAYSVTDVAYLGPLFDILTDRLEKIGRLSWALEEFEIQEQVRYEINYNPPLFVKFKGAGKMDNRTLAILENLLQLRLDIAKEKDRPLFKVFSNKSLRDIAEGRLKTPDQMMACRALSKKQSHMYGERCRLAVDDALKLDHKSLPSYPRVPPPQRKSHGQGTGQAVEETPGTGQ